MTLDESILDIIENHIKLGHLEISRCEIKKISPTQLPRKHMARLTHLSRRCGLNQFGLKLLAPLIHPDKPLAIPANNEEKVAYASCLTNIGATEESLKILTSVPLEKNPEILLFQVFAYFSQWKYGSSIPLLKQYLNLLTIEDYNYWVGVTNLAAALIAENHLSEAEVWLLKLREQCEKKSYQLLLGNTLMLLAQSYIQNQNYELAKLTLQSAELTTKNNTGLYQSLIQKWKLIIKLLTCPNELIRKEATNFKYVSINNGYWETVRDVDFYTAKAFNDSDLFYKVYYGTPYISYRRRIKKEWPLSFTPPEDIILNDVTDKTFPEIRLIMGNHFLSSKLFYYLILDHYQPIRGGKLFSLLYPDEYYNPFSSPHRLNQLIHRFKKEKIFADYKLKIKCQQFSYKLSLPTDQKIILGLPYLNKNKMTVPNWLKLVESHGESTFSSQKLQSLLNISQRTAQRYLQSALTSQLLIKLGRGRSTVYQIKRRFK